MNIAEAYKRLADDQPVTTDEVEQMIDAKHGELKKIAAVFVMEGADKDSETVQSLIVALNLLGMFRNSQNF